MVNRHADVVKELNITGSKLHFEMMPKYPDLARKIYMYSTFRAKHGPKVFACILLHYVLLLYI